MLIGLSGKARVGKDTVAGYLEDHFGFKRVAFADSLKRACREIFHLSERQLYGDMKEVEDPFWHDTPRNILQMVGTECLRRGYEEDVWVRSLERTIQLGGGAEKNWVVTDVRFPNEARAVKSWGGKLVLVDRPDAPTIATNKHASETAMEAWGAWDYRLDNNQDLPQLYANIEIMMKELGGS